MTPLEKTISIAAFNAIKSKARSVTTIDQIILGGALKNDLQFSQLPPAQQRHFLDVAMAVVNALQAAHSAGPR